MRAPSARRAAGQPRTTGGRTRSNRRARSSGRSRTAGIVAALGLAACISLSASGQVVDRSGQGGTLSGRIDAVVREAGSAAAGAGFIVAFRFRGLIPSDAEAGGGGYMIIQRYGGWTVTGGGGLQQTTDSWDPLEGGERLLDLSSMSMVAPGPEPTLVVGPLIAFVRGSIGPDGRARLQSMNILLPAGVLRLRGRTVYWVGEAPADQVLGWARAALDLPAERTPRTLARELAGLVSVLPEEAAPVDLLASLATGHQDRDVRQRAITYLGRRPEDTVRVLEGILQNADSTDERAAALQALADRLGPASRDRLIRTARDGQEEESLRLRAVSYLGRVPGGEVDGVLENLLSDPSERIRRQTAEAWEGRQARRAVPLLEGVARNDEIRDVRMQAVSSLGDIEAEEATRALERLFANADEEELRVKALQELAPRRAEGRVEWLAGLALNDASMEVRKEAVRQLGRLGDDPAARRALQRIIDVGRP